MAFRPFVQLLFFLLFLPYWYYSANATANGSFSIQLFHRDSPQYSPLYNPSTTPFHRFTEAIRRSLDRSRSSSLSTSLIRSITSLDVADYLMNFSIGTPPVQVSVLVDTGSDLLWSRCNPCVDCANRQVPFLNPTESSSYKELPCDSSPCKFFNPDNACEKGPECNYTYAYGGGSSTIGILSTETLAFDSTEGGTISFDNIVLGCGHNNSLSFDDRLYGLAGLGGSTYSLISQLSPTIKGKFSYCLVPAEESVSSTSVMNFGDEAIISGPDVVSTSLISRDDKNLYFVALEHISVGGNKIEVKPDASNSGNAFIDTGTTVTVLDADAFKQLTSILSSIVKLPADNATGSLCFHANSRDGFPAITFHFADGADLVLKPWNTYSELKNEGLVCLLMVPADGLSILGNIIQQNFHVAYDLEGKKVSFQSTQCSKLSK